MTWTQPVCENRLRELYPDRNVTHLIVPESKWEPCCFCGTLTGIYVRIDPKTVPFPRKDSDDAGR